MYVRAIYDTQVKWEECKKLSINPKLVALAVQGLIYHFQNRNWLLNDSYTFIMQSAHRIVFNEAMNNLAQFKTRLEDAGVLHLVDITHVESNETEGDAPEED